MKMTLKKQQKSPGLLEKIIVDLQEKLDKETQEAASSKAELASYKEKYAPLIEELLLAKQQRFSPSSEKNILQPDLFDEAGVELSDEIKEHLEDGIEVKSYARKKYPVRRPLPSYLPREKIVYDIAEADKIFGCGVALVRIGEEVS
jgi:transposase